MAAKRTERGLALPYAIVLPSRGLTLPRPPSPGIDRPWPKNPTARAARCFTFPPRTTRRSPSLPRLPATP
ncbi:hypothetical protein MPL3356_70185 [Mesorhizobium plurifarium]|uniref:Uncharacterized protein n=1 Tax=Mesorhizobium plurifarium TaxID=69974 RepID=A0A090G9T0_MESPL|nr:hypothetical protein MPL3356_70185 [Mesorhizobium plurifarium]